MRRTIVSDLTLGLTVTIALVSTTVGLFYYVSSTSIAEERLINQAKGHVKRLSDSLATPLLNKDEATVIRTAGSYQQLYELAVLRVFNAADEAIYDPVVTKDKGLTTAMEPVHWHGHYVGSVEVSLTQRGIKEAQQISLYLTLSIMFSVVVSVIVASRLLLKTFLQRPLAAIAQGIEVIANGSYDQVLAPTKRWDIDIIIENINVMASQIATRDRRLRDLIEEVENSRDDLRKSLEETVTTLASTTEKRDPYTSGHQERVNRLALAIARELGLPDQQIEGLHIAALLHDIGKIALPAEFLAKPTQLLKIEKTVIEHHTEVGYEILKNIHFPWPVAEIVYQHHEHLDGSGYPRGLTDKDILLEAKIIAVADVVEAMSSHRPYRPSLGIASALSEIRAGKGTLYHGPSVDVCLHLFQEKKFDFFQGD